MQEIDSRVPLGKHRERPLGSAPPTSQPTALEAGPFRQRAMSLGPGEIDRQLEEMNEQFNATFDELLSRPRQRQGSSDRQSSTGSSTARAPSSGAPTIGRRTQTLDSPYLGRTGELPNIPGPSHSRRSSLAEAYPPSFYPRPRFPSTGSARSGVSIASGEVLGRMDPEIEDERRRSRGQL